MIPKAYKRNPMTKLLWLYKNNIITRDKFIHCTDILRYSHYNLIK
jgi:uncharacterized protein YqgQ